MDSCYKIPVLAEHSMRTENTAVPCHDRCLIQVIPSLLERQESVPGNPSGILVYIRMEEPGRLHDAALVRIRQPDRTGGAALPVADEKGRDRRRRCEFFRLAFPFPVRAVVGPRGSDQIT